ncbi:GMC family oxidoreductase [Tianweitania sediminis]|uniref:GMC family oxidoreductase N-terminal domain-containing protein n=1 Tax=Tianweitania sediminis TaxID=1502156 RepID=A0A8J7R2Z6_9HYPH|nr:GMC family oxidoreductase N-terminal domain-containing protein [Tianweitania sediminis]MBP0439948.1 GMC family oxidoreductase N-terminal domain-containing protein [Tianweitania sediminis]
MSGDTAKPADTFDYVVIGTGAAGSVIAARLAEDEGVSICALESGPPDRHPYIHLPAGFIKIMFNPKYTWQFKTEPGEGVNGRQVIMPLGRTVGGSSSINGMVINRGQAADFDSWAQSGNRGWAYRDVLPYFRRFERRLGDFDPAYRGGDGNIPVSDLDWIHPICEAFIEGAQSIGIPRNPDYNSGEQPGVGYFQRAIHRGWRMSAGRTYLLPAMKRTRRIDLRTRARATSIIFEGRRAVGVRFVDERDRTTIREVRARREVIVCAGTINTPRLLQLSGIGPRRHLAELGVPVIHDLAGVGENFRDHCSVRVVARGRPGHLTMNELTRGVRLWGQALRWATGRPSVLALSPSLVHCFWKSEPEMDGADLQVVFTPASYKQGFVSLLDDFPGMSCGVWQHRPESRGYVRATSLDPFVDPAIQPNYLTHPVDQRAMIKGIRLARRLLRTEPMSRFVERETFPDPAMESDADILNWARQYGASVWHLIGTARMGPRNDPAAVVDHKLRVHGLERLRVVDASIMPTMPSANTYASTLMIAEKAADMIRGRSFPSDF